MDYWQTLVWYVCLDAFIGCSENHKRSHLSPEEYVNVLYVTYWPAGSLCNIGLESVLLKRACFIRQRIMNTLGGVHKDMAFLGSERSRLDSCNVWGWGDRKKEPYEMTSVFIILKKKNWSFYWMQNWLSMFVKQSCALKPNSLMWTSLTLLIIWPSKSKALWLCSSMVVCKVSSDIFDDDSWPSLRSAICCYVTDWKCCL